MTINPLHEDRPQRFATPDEPWQRDLSLYAADCFREQALSVSCFEMREQDNVLIEAVCALIAGYGQFVARAIQYARDHAEDESKVESTDRAIGIMRERMKAAMADELAHWWPGFDDAGRAH